MSPSAEKSAATDWLQRQGRKIGTHDTLEVSEVTAAAVEVEAWLQKHGVEYAPPTHIPMVMIDERRSRQNQARKDALLSESVDRYANAWRTGAKFPPIVVYPSGGKLIIIDGNNRQAAARRATKDSIWGIVVSDKTPSEMIQLLTVEANAGHGVTPDLSWRLKQAFYLISLGFSDAEAAEAAAVTPLQVRNARAVQEADARARTLRVYGFGDLPATVRGRLNVLRDEAVFHAAARLTAGQKLSNDQVADLVRVVKAERSEADRLAVIAEWAKEFDVESAMKKAMKKGVSSPKNALVSGIGLITKCDHTALVNQILTAHDRDLVNERLNTVVEKILEIQVAMESLKGLD